MLHWQNKVNSYDNASAIILSGGRSVRMGSDKCDLRYNGRTLLNIQVDKMKEVGITDIIASGYRGKECDAKVVADDIMKGPLSGILKGLNQIENDRAFVISVDTPLVKVESIQKLIRYSFEKDREIVLTRHSGKNEPLMGVFKKSISDKIEKVIKSEKHSVMKLVELCSYDFLDLDDDEMYFMNINYREDYDTLLKINLEGGK